MRIRWMVSLFLMMFALNNPFVIAAAESDTGFVTVMSDMAITAQVIAKIALDQNVSNRTVDVATHAGTVIYTGSVNSDFEKNKLVDIAMSTSGVKAVDTSHLQIAQSEQVMSDTLITAKVKALLIKDELLGKETSAGIHVETQNGIVYLTGSVESDTEMKNVIRVAHSVEGVKEVKAKISIVKK